MAKRKTNLESFKKLLKYKALSEDLVVDIVYQLGRSDALIEEWDKEYERENKKISRDENIASDEEIFRLMDDC